MNGIGQQSSTRDTTQSQIKSFLKNTGISAIAPNSVKVMAILSETSARLDVADRFILRKAGDIYTDVIGRAAADVATGTVTVRQAVGQAVDEFAKRGITSFVDIAGSSWQMSSYAEMAEYIHRLTKP